MKIVDAVKVTASRVVAVLVLVVVVVVSSVDKVLCTVGIVEIVVVVVEVVHIVKALIADIIGREPLVERLSRHHIKSRSQPRVSRCHFMSKLLKI